MRQNLRSVSFAARRGPPAGRDRGGFRAPGTPVGSLRKAQNGHYAKRNVSPGPRSPARRRPRPQVPCRRRRPADQTFALTPAHTGARVSEALAICPKDVDLEAASIRIRTLKRRAERWREVPVPPELLRALVHALRSAPAKAAARPLWPWSRATAHRKIAGIMTDAGIEGPQACPKGLRHGFGIAAVAAGVPLPTIAAALGHANLQTTAVYTTASGLEAREFLARMWEREGNSGGSGV